MKLPLLSTILAMLLGYRVIIVQIIFDIIFSNQNVFGLLSICLISKFCFLFLLFFISFCCFLSNYFFNKLLIIFYSFSFLFALVRYRSNVCTVFQKSSSILNSTQVSTSSECTHCSCSGRYRIGLVLGCEANYRTERGHAQQQQYNCNPKAYLDIITYVHIWSTSTCVPF